jgi:hypothetical protein
MDLSSVPMWKRVLAGCGLLTLVVSAVVITARVVEGQAAAGPSELTLHPERQDEILADRRADSLGQKLGMNPEQTAELSRIIEGFQQARLADRQQYAGNLLGLMQARRAAMQDLDTQVQALLTAEQRANYANVKSDLMGRVAGLQQLRPMLAPNMPALPLPGANPTAENTP